MHVLIIPSEAYVPPDAPLLGIFQKDQAEALKKAGYDVGVITVDLTSRRLFGSPWKGDHHGLRIEDPGGIPCHRFRSWNWFALFGDAAAWAWVRAGMSLFKQYVRQRGEPEVIHAHNGILAGRLARQIKKLTGIPYVVTEHSSDFARRRLGHSTIKSIGEAYADASVVAAVSHSLGERLESLYGSAVRSWVMIPNMLDPSFQQASMIARRSNDGGNGFRFLNVASLQEVKGHATLLRAFAGSFKGDPSVRLRIVGDGTLMERLRKMVDDLGIYDHVHFTGYQNRREVLKEMQSCDAFVLSSLYETFGVVLIEALACGKPVISTACGGPQGIINDGNGILVPANDRQALGHAMTAIRSEIGKYDAAVIRSDCIARFGADAVVGMLTKAYERAAGG